MHFTTNKRHVEFKGKLKSEQKITHSINADSKIEIWTGGSFFIYIYIYIRWYASNTNIEILKNPTRSFRNVVIPALSRVANEFYYI